jgi:hypothetical protein
MAYKIGLENGDENRSIAWVLGHPGCFAYGPDGDSALAAAPAAIREYMAWIKNHDQGECWLPDKEIEVQLDDVWEVYSIDENYDRAQMYSVNAWFLHDWKPLTETDIERGMNLISWSRQDLLEAVQDLSQETLEREYPNERWSISGILGHVANAEWWYLDRLGLAFPREELPKDPFERLAKERAFFCEKLPPLVGTNLVVGTEGEFWSPRKVLRRAVWHERDHTGHIKSLLAKA